MSTEPTKQGLPRAEWIGMRIADIGDARERAALPSGTEATFRQDVYAGDFTKIDDHWYGDHGRIVGWPHWLIYARITKIPGLERPPVVRPESAAPPAADRRDDSTRRAALERIASGTAGASPSEVETARRELNR